MKEKRWRCTVCNYIHIGEEPPEICPECGVGPEFFEFLDEVEADLDEDTRKRIQKTLFKIQYGLYVVTAKKDEKINGQIANTIFQITSSPLVIAAGINKDNLTHEYIQAAGAFTVSVLGQDSLELVRRFGFKSGRQVDKFEGLEYSLSSLLNNPVPQGSIAYFDCKVMREKCVDLGSHTLFIAEVRGGEVFEDKDEPITYEGYRKMRGR